MSKITNIMIAGLMLLGSTAMAATATTTDQALFNSYLSALHNASLLYLQSSNSATIVPIKGQAGVYKISLTNTSAYTTYFADRPEAISGIVPTENFVGSWSKGKDSFNQNSPNAALEGISTDKTQHVSYIFTLSNVSYDTKTQTLSFDGKLINGTTVINKLGYNSLFIDFTWNNNLG